MLLLKLSSIQGVGVFTTQAIRSGEHLRLWHPDDWRFLTFAEAESDPDFREVGKTYCVSDAGGYWCPLDFHRMSIGYYMNHSGTPNVHTSKDLNYEYFALRDIAAGEEILCDYRKITPYECAPDGARP